VTAATSRNRTKRRASEVLAAESAAKRCAIYSRKSTAKGLEQDFNSCDAQRAACEAYIGGKAGWSLVEDTYEDGGFTGANMDRPAFQRLLADVDAGKVDVVVVYKVDRLSRSLLDFAQVMERFNLADVAFVSVTQSFSTADAIGRLTLNMLISFSEFEREMIADRTRDKIAASRRRGKWTGGPVPYGFDVLDRKLVVSEFEAVVVREVFATYEAQHSILAVIDELNARARPRKLRAGAAASATWNKAAVLQILRDPRHAGLMPYYDERHQGEHAAIIDRELFERVQTMLDAGTRVGAARPTRHLIQGLTVCARCGYAMVIVTTRKGGGSYSYVRCSSRDRKGPSACPTHPLPLGPVTEAVLDRVREAARDVADEQPVLRELRRRVATARDALSIERATLATSAGEASAQLGRLVEALANVSGAARAAAEKKLEETGQAHGRWTQRLREIEGEIAALASREVEATWVAQTLRDFGGLWAAMTDANRRRLVQALVQKIVIDEPSGEIAVHLYDVGEAPRAPASGPSLTAAGGEGA